MVDDEALEHWCSTHLGASVVAQAPLAAHLSEVLMVDLADGRTVVVKIRPASPRIRACTAVQGALHRAGFPCAQPLTVPAPVGHRMATAETYVDAHEPPPLPPPPEPTAALLAELIRLSPPPLAHPALSPAPPWVGWDHTGDKLWPWPDDLNVDLNIHSGPSWVDDIARRVRAALLTQPAGDVIGHADWEAHNLAWSRGLPVLVHDWDSLAIRPEPTIAGAAAAVYPSHGATVAATVEQTAAFLDAYASQRPWSANAERMAWAAGLWVLSYNARKESLGGGGGYLVSLAAEADERVRRAGL